MWHNQALIILATFIVGLHAHGRLMDPPARNAMWRYGFPNPINYNDNEVYCGGVGVQFGQNDGKCGVCGDDWRQEPPRDHEAHGKYGNGIIGRRYAMGQKITVEVELTTNHLGHFTLKLCPINDKTRIATEECFDKYPLVVADSNSTDYIIPDGLPKTVTIKYDVYLPQGVSCQQCVMQWTYYTGNTWGKCDNGTEGMGCGPQETFRNCADVTIYSLTGAFPPDVSTSNSIEEFPYAIYVNDAIEGKYPLIVRSQVCVPTSEFATEKNSDEWCTVNCLKYPPNCPKDKCSCLIGCRAIGPLAGVEGTDVYCLRNCFKNNASECPRDECECYGEEDLDIEEKSIETTTIF